MPTRPNPYLILALGVTGISFSAFFARMTGAPPAVIAFWRLFFTCLGLLPLAWRERAQLSSLAKGDLLLSVLSGLFLTFHFLFWYASLRLTSISSATLLVNIHPLVLVGVGWLGPDREQVRPSSLLWAGAALVGIALLAGGSLGVRGALAGNLLAAAGALMLAGYYLAGRRVRRRVSLSLYALMVYSSSALFLLGGNLVTATPLTGYGLRDWLVFVALAAVPTLCGHTLLNWCLKYLPAGTVSIGALGEPVLATLLAIPLLGEIPGPLQWAGGLLVVGGIGMFIRTSSAKGPG